MQLSEKAPIARRLPSVPTKSHWCRIVDPVWQGTEADIRRGLPFEILSPIWQMFLLGDGAPTRHLQLLTQSDITVDVIAITPIGESDDQAPVDIAAIPAPRIRRQIWLRSAKTGEVFSHATSWWSEEKYARYLSDPSLPIWASLNQKHAELYRDLKGIYCGTCADLEDAFGTSEPYWGRHYLLWNQEQPITMIYEVYSPVIAKYLGVSKL